MPSFAAAPAADAQHLLSDVGAGDQRLEEGDVMLVGQTSGWWRHRHDKVNRSLLLAAPGVAFVGLAAAAYACCAPRSASPAGASQRWDGLDGIVMEAAANIQPCRVDEKFCPEEWLTAKTGGYLCRKFNGCRPWTSDGGPWLEEMCPDQCSLGNTPTHHNTAPASAPAAAGGDHGKREPSAPADHGAAGARGAPPTADNAADGAVLPCDDGEATCPEEWATAEHGGYYCRQGGGCSPWTKLGGAFPKAVCPDQCSIGFTPMTITTTITSTTITSTYVGMGIKLFCWSLAQPGYEQDILTRQLQLYAGIFACDDRAIVSFVPITLQNGEDKVESLVSEQVDVGMSKDGTAGNALQFMKAWEAIQHDGRYRNSDWVVKMDPDAVLLPDRLRMHLNPFNGGNVYIRNCDKPMSEGTMMFGAMEAISRPALESYYAGFSRCWNEVPWHAWGEDLFMMRCLEHLGVGDVGDYGIIQDGVCKGVWCGDNFAAAFHPMKSVGAWEGCWNEAVSAR